MRETEQYEQYRSHFEALLTAHCESLRTDPPVLGESMRYSLLCGGKRLRPVLFYAMLDALGGDWRREENFPLAIECIHTYSLIHDDLPAMDNDDYRRGRPSNHMMFGEGNAVLAGDALLSHAFHLLLSDCGEPRRLRAALRLSRAAGIEGMVAGQSADLLYTGKQTGKETLFSIYRKKTAELITAPLSMAAILCGRAEREAEQYGEDLGILFQLTDDILDEKGVGEKMGKTLGKDKKEGKATCVRVFGMEESERLADHYAQACRNAFAKTEGSFAFLKAFADSVRKRDR